MKRESIESDDTLLELADLASRGMLDAEGYIQLDELLLSNPSNLKAYVEYLHLHAKLAELTTKPKSRAMVFLDRAPARKQSQQYLTYLAVVIVPFVLIAIGLAFRQSGQKLANQVATILPTAPEEVASIRGLTSSTRWMISGTADSKQISAGKTISVDEGAIEMMFFAGARMLVEAPAKLTVADPMSVKLEHGRLRTTVKPGLSGFKVETESMKVVDLGTEFLVDVAQDGKAISFVTQGVCRVTNLTSAPNQKKELTIEAGSCVMTGHHHQLTLLSDQQSLLACEKMISSFARYDLGIQQMSDSVCITSSDIIKRSEGMENHLVYLIPERQRVFMKQELRLQDENGTTVIPAGTLVDSYLLRFSFGEDLPVDSKKRVLSRVKTSGFVTFQNPAIAVLGSEHHLIETDPLLSDLRSRNSDNALEAGDRIYINGATINFELTCEARDTDQIRILVHSK